jgi:holliday junction DNA helicase RuvA
VSLLAERKLQASGASSAEHKKRNAHSILLCYNALMISRIKGTILDIADRSVVVDIQGLGYKVFVTDDTLHGLKIGTPTELYTHLAVRENALDLYGFTSNKEKDFFELLISISGIGPKSALNILSLVSSDTLLSSIRTGSTAHLVKVSGIGRKTAEKIVLELKDKLGGLSGEDMSAGMSSDADAIEALKALGYDQSEAREALKKVSKDVTNIGSKVKAALKILT